MLDGGYNARIALMIQTLKKNWPVIAIVVLALVAVSVALVIIFTRHADADLKPAQPVVYHVQDDSLGLSFKVSKDFERIPPAELQALNPNFVYGFRPKGVADTSCVVSQTTRLQSGSVTTDELAQGTYDETKKSYPDVQVLSAKKRTLNGRQAAQLELSFTDVKTKVKRLEVVATTDKKTTFAFCSSPQALAGFYRDTFTVFLTSLIIK